jgi:hypothetical protein
VTDEGQEPTVKWVAAKGAKYPYGYDKGGKMKRFFGVGGIPDAILIDPNGVVVWRGHPAGLKKSTIEEHLKGALEKPISSWPAAAKKARQAFQKGEIAKALEEARALGEAGAPVVAALEGLVEGKLELLKSAGAQGDWLAVLEHGERFAKQLSGLPQADEVKAALARLEDDKAAQVVLDAQQDVRKLMSGKIKKRDKERIEKKLKEILAEHRDTAAARDAERALVELRGR